MQPVALMKWHKRTVWQMAELFSTFMFFLLTSPQTSFSISCTENHPQTKNILQPQTPKKDGKCELLKAKHGFFSKFCKPQIISASECQNWS